MLVYPINVVAGVDVLYILADGTSQCSATLDDSVSEEEEDGSFDELTDITPYLQPGVELSVLNEVSVRTDACHIVTLYRYLLQKCNFCCSIFLHAFLVVSYVKKCFRYVCLRCLAQFRGADNHCSLDIILHARHGLRLHVIVFLSHLCVLLSG